jgi:UDP-3-O-[3-hydroxymyristoyl] glucosamine N-acyltransferase
MMADPDFFPSAQVLTLARIGEIARCDLPAGADPVREFANVAPLETAGPNDIAYMDNARYVEALRRTRAGLLLVAPRFMAAVPEGTIALVCREPYRAFGEVMGLLFPSALRPGSAFESRGVAPGAFVHHTARLEHGVTVDPGAVIGAHAEVGSGTIVGAHAVIGRDVRVGRDCAIGAHATLQYALLGNRVIIHPGVRIGQDGFGFAMGPKGHRKVPQIGRVIIQDDVEIGANSTVDRGASRDTIIGEGTKIDNLVQIGHNVVIGRHCVIVSHVGISGSTTLGDFVVLAGQVGVAGHLTIGSGAQIAAQSGVIHDVPAGARWGGSPARPAREWMRDIVTMSRLSRAERSAPAREAAASRDDE